MTPVIRIVGNLEVMHVLTQDVGNYQIYDLPKRHQCLPINLHSCSDYKRRTPCPAVLTHPSSDGLEYRTPGPSCLNGTVGNMSCRMT